jgi:hypothetical protein
MKYYDELQPEYEADEQSDVEELKEFYKSGLMHNRGLH